MAHMAHMLVCFGRTLPHNQVAPTVGKKKRNGSHKFCPVAKQTNCFSHMAWILQNTKTITISKDKTIFRPRETSGFSKLRKQTGLGKEWPFQSAIGSSFLLSLLKSMARVTDRFQCGHSCNWTKTKSSPQTQNMQAMSLRKLSYKECSVLVGNRFAPYCCYTKPHLCSYTIKLKGFLTQWDHTKTTVTQKFPSATSLNKGSTAKCQLTTAEIREAQHCCSVTLQHNQLFRMVHAKYNMIQIIKIKL